MFLAVPTADTRVVTDRVRAAENVMQPGCWFLNDLTWQKKKNLQRTTILVYLDPSAVEDGHFPTALCQGTATVYSVGVGRMEESCP